MLFVNRIEDGESRAAVSDEAWRLLSAKLLAEVEVKE